MNRFAHFLALLAWLMTPRFAVASEYHGVVQFGGLPVPGATIAMSRGDQKFTAVTDPQGAYVFADLADGTWMIEVVMPGFAAVHGDVNVAPGAAASAWELKMLPFAEVMKDIPATVAATPAPAAANATATASAAASSNNRNRKTARVATPQRPGGFQRADVNASGSEAASAADAVPSNTGVPANTNDADLASRASDGFLINGSANNGAASSFSQSAAFGNNRRGSGSLYNGSLGLIFDNSAFDARSYSLTGQDTPRPAYEQTKGVFTLGGPLSIPHLLPTGPMFFVGYQWTRNRNANTQSALVPTLAEREGDAGGGVALPTAQINPQAQALL
ncbi:MAG TPA: carboxypeptidase-like regulatory domain-containing protein, partial [Rhizomicrobium sp.]|nr:carboxypeptidase-like regulatory domain-containing protein [Rhizomicrobium sp.]